MAENREEIRRDRQKRINQSKDKNNLIADNGLDGKVIDVYDILNRSSDPTVIKLRKLREYGITDEMIAESYADITSSVENKDSAIDALSAVFKKLALYINQQPNGIVLDLNTGELDKKASYRQAVRVGIASDTYFERFEKKGKKLSLEDMLKLKETANKENKYIEKFSKEISKSYSSPELKKYLDENPELLNISLEAKEVLKKSRKEIAQEDPNLMELYKIEIEIDNASGTPMHEAMLKERERFLRTNPKYRSVASEIRDENNNINPNVVSKYNDYNKKVKINCLLSQLAMANDKDLSSLSPSERKILITAALAGLRVSQTPYEKITINKECWKLLKAIAPEIDNKKGGIYSDKLFPFLERELELDEKLDRKKFSNLLDISSEAMDKSLNLDRYRDFFKARKLIAGKAKKIADKIFNKYFADPNNVQEINFQEELEKADKTDLEIYFNESNIKFSKNDEKEFNDIYRDCTVDSWIDSKDKALSLRYAALVRARDKLTKKPDTKYYRKKMEDVEKGISDFKQEHPDLKYEKEDGTLLDDINEQAEEYQNKMVESALLKFYSLDVREHNNKEKKYSELDSEHKKAYLRNAIVGLKYGEQSNNKSILKLAQRRLELLNTPDKTFIFFENGNPIISEKQILEEYNAMSEYNYSTYEELVTSSEDRKEAYLLKKLEEYSKLKDSDFIKLDFTSDKDEKLTEIEKIKAASNIPQATLENNGKQDVDKKKEHLSENNSDIEYQTENVGVNEKEQKMNWIQRSIASFRNLFNPRLTDGMVENSRTGFLNKVFGKRNRNTIVPTEESSNTVVNQQVVDNRRKNSDWSYQGFDGDANKISKPQEKTGEGKKVEQDGQEH